MLVGQRLRVLVVLRADADLLELAHQRNDTKMIDALDARPEDRQHLGVTAGEQPRRDGRGGGRPDRGDVRAVHERHARTRAGVVKTDLGQVRGQPRVVVLLEHGHDLYRHEAARARSGHAEQQRIAR
jgi:hypothetical protein